MSHYKPYPAYRDSGVEWLTRVPVEWAESRIWGHFEETNSRGGSKEELLSVSQAHGVMPQSEYEVTLGRRLSQQASENYSNYKRVRKGDLIYNKMRMWQGAIGVAPTDGIVSPAYITFRQRHNHLSAFWAELFRVSSFLVEVNRRSQGICDDQNSCNYEDFRQIVVPVPPTNDQVAIMVSLDRETTRIDALITKKTRFIELLKEKRSALITHAVTKGLDSNAKMKDSGVEWIGEVPEGWEVKRLRHIASFKNSNVDKKSYEGQGAVNLCNYTDVYYNEFITSDMSFMPATASSSEIEQFALKKGDVIITKDSEDPSDIGIPAVVADDLPGVVCGYHLTMIRVADLDTARILHRSLQSHPTQAHFFVEAPGITRYGLGQDAIGDLHVCIPPEPERENLADQIDRETTRIDTLISKVQRSIDLLKERRSALITAAVTGQIDVRDHAATIGAA
ncbi:restriction endonuclease subunit S domain-containing protein [Acidiferrobacter sp.]